MMLDTFTWGEYFSAIGLAATGYYTVIGMLYYRRELTALLKGKIKKTIHKEIQEPTAAYDGENGADEDELEAVVADLKRSVLDQAGKEAGKTQLLRQLKQRLANYDGLRQPAYRVAVNGDIINYAKDSCGVAFSEDELNEVWDTLPR